MAKLYQIEYLIMDEQMDCRFEYANDLDKLKEKYMYAHSSGECVDHEFGGFYIQDKTLRILVTELNKYYIN